MGYDSFYVLFMSINLSVTFIIMLAACLCCRKKIPKNEFLGLEGMVKIKNPEENVDTVDSSIHIDISTSTVGETDSKRASNAPHRSLPDIPIAENINDNGSELYATVADKVQEKPQGRSPALSLKKQTSVSQHSSISQADDVSSPYARVKTPPHNYDKVRSTEHPYAQLNAPGASTSTNSPIFESTLDGSSSQRDSNQSLLGNLEPQQEIPAASAIAGMVSASQELPYMTPPIVQQPHFSGDSQDSSKGYTSISVREPLANILAQTTHPRTRMLQKDASDSHYATVSDDSDEMYAAIDDRNNHGDIYTSGSETYAQIQPAANSITVSVEINTTTSRVMEHPEPSRLSSHSIHAKPIETPAPPPVDSLRAQMHSRQASSSSNTSSVGILGSPKPEKRQANSPLPPTPKLLQFNSSNTNLTSTSSIPSGRNSVASVIECPLPQSNRIASKENVAVDSDEGSARKKNLSPSKDIEGMYAKVMKKNKFSNVPSQNSSPILSRKLSSGTNSPEINACEVNVKNPGTNIIHTSPGKSSIKSASYLENNYETIDKRRPRSNSYNNKDHGYETIPANKINGNNNLFANRKSEGYTPVFQKDLLHNESGLPLSKPGIDFQNTKAQFQNETNNCKESGEPGYESLPDQTINAVDHGYETLLKSSHCNDDGKNPNSDYDPNYEILQPGKYSNSSDDGYAKVWEKQRTDDDSVDGYSRVKERGEDENVPGYSSIDEKKSLLNPEGKFHDYASISEAKKHHRQNGKSKSNNNNNNDETCSDIYSSIPNEQALSYLETPEDYHNYQVIGDAKQPMTIVNSNNSKSSDKLPTPSTGQNSPDRQMKCSSTSNTISSSQQQSSSNYESLTGSESDPNYESVRYLDSENPYERLHSDSNISPDVAGSVSGTIGGGGGGCNTPSSSNDVKSFSRRTPEQKSSATNSENGEVGDYFQV